MIKSEIRSLITNLLPKWDKSGKYHPKIIDAAIERVLGELYNESFKVSPHSLQRYTKGYGYTVPITVSVYGTTFYSLVPEKIIPFPDKASGVRRVGTPIVAGMTFFPIDAREIDLISGGSYSDTVTSKIGYRVTQTDGVLPLTHRVDFYNMTMPQAVTGVRMDLIIPFSAYTETENVLIPEIPDAQGRSFIDRVLGILGVIQPVDSLDDNKDKQIQNNKQ